MDAFTATRRDGKIILELDEQTWMRDALSGPGDALTITDREQFLRFALQNIFTLTHDVDDIDQPNSWWLRLAQALGKTAGSVEAGVHKTEAPVPTCRCDPEEYDGG